MTAAPADTDTRPLLRALADQQQRVLGILVGLDEDALRRPVLPSGWCCLGMVRHLTLMTRFWFRDVMTGTRSDHPADEFDVHHLGVADVLNGYAHETAATAALVQGLPGGTAPVYWPEGQWGDWRLSSLSEVLAHVLVETSCHAGHLDAARELLDGRTWDYETDQLTDGY